MLLKTSGKYKSRREVALGDMRS